MAKGKVINYEGWRKLQDNLKDNYCYRIGSKREALAKECHVTKNAIGWMIKDGFLYEETSGILRPTQPMTNEMISGLYLKHNRKPKHQKQGPGPDLFNTEEERMCKESEEFISQMATPKVTYTPIAKGFPILPEGECGLTTVLVFLKQMTLIVPKELEGRIKINIEFV